MATQAYISRILSWKDLKDKEQFVEDTDILRSFDGPMVILGGPGMGKSRLMKDVLGEEESCCFIKATSFLRQPIRSYDGSTVLVIDGLDEVSAAKDGDPLDHVLYHLVQCGCPRFILSCRSAEWSSVRGCSYIEDEYKTTPREFHLQPLTEKDALGYLVMSIDSKAANKAISKLRYLGLDEFYSNPLFLEFVRSILVKKGSVPESRTELYEKAVRQLRKETLDRDLTPLANLSESSAFDAAGCIMAVFLIGGFYGVSKLNSSEDRILSVIELSDYVPVADLKAVLGSNLFKSESSATGVFVPQHRTIAEYMGAQWLATFVSKSRFKTRTARRIQSLISALGGVPSSLRGLNAWIPVFCHGKLGTIALRQDPYGVLRFGDGDSLSVFQARLLIAELRILSNDDPRFRNQWEDTLFLKGLVHKENLETVESIIHSLEEPYDLRVLLFESIISLGETAPTISGLNEIGLDSKRGLGERLLAIRALKLQHGKDFEWDDLVESILASEDRDSSRLALFVFDKVGYDLFSTALISKTVLTHFEVGNAEEDDDDERYAIGELYALERRFPLRRVGEFLDLFSDAILPFRNPKRWWETSNRDGWSHVIELINFFSLRYLEEYSESVDPRRLVKWLEASVGDEAHSREEKEKVHEILARNHNLRQRIQRIVLFDAQDPKDFSDHEGFLTDLSRGLRIQHCDARLYLTEIVERADRRETPAWYSMANALREENGYIPYDVQKLARTFASTDMEMLRFLRTKPKKRKLSEAQKKYRRRLQRSKQRRLRKQAETRADFGLHLDELRRGDLKWVLRPAKAYLGRYSDLNRKAEPETRLTEWLGEEIKDVALEGFEAVLHREDLPSPLKVSQGYTEDVVWLYVYPMLAGLACRFLGGIGFDGVPTVVISAALIAAEKELNETELGFDGLTKVLRTELNKDQDVYDQHLRDRFEPRIVAGCAHIEGIYEFTGSARESARVPSLCMEWLERFSEIALETERELALCVARCLNSDLEVRFAAIVQSKLADSEKDSEQEVFWRSLQFVFSPEEAIPFIPEPSEITRDWMWNLTLYGYHYSREESFVSFFNIRQLEWLVENYRYVWPMTHHSTRFSYGSQNAWDATDLIRGLVDRVASKSSDEAGEALARLRQLPEDDYSEYIQAAIAKHSKLWLESHYQPMSLSTLKCVLSDEPPRSAADVLTIVVNEINELQKRIRGDSVNTVNGFYTENGIPKVENDCRDEMLKLLRLPYGITDSPEVAMPQGNRADTGFSFGEISIPLEAKGQWHLKVWSAASAQLDRLYARDFRADSKGIYVVFWFGTEAPTGRKIKTPPDGVDIPSSPDGMRESLVRLIPAHRRSDLEVVVLDLTRP